MIEFWTVLYMSVGSPNWMNLDYLFSYYLKLWLSFITLMGDSIFYPYRERAQRTFEQILDHNGWATENGMASPTQETVEGEIYRWDGGKNWAKMEK